MQSSTAFFVLLCVAAPATSLPIPRHPRYAIHHVGQDAGLATLTVTALAQDGDGLIWIGTPSGLYRFDGAVAELFSEAEGLPGAYVEQLITAPDGRVFAVASRGIASFDGLRFVPLESPLFAQPAAGSLQAVAFDRSGRIYVATEAGLARVDGPDGADGRLFGAAAGIPRRVVAVAASRAGDVWIAMPGAIGKLVDDGVTPIALPPSLAPDDATALLADALGGLWIRTRHHVARLEPGASEARVVGEDVPSSNDFGIPALDRAGRLLVPTVAGLHLERDGRWISVGEDQGLASSAVTAVMEDRDAVLWLGLGGSGLDRWPNPDTFLGWTKAEGLPDNVVWALARDARKRLWIGTNDGIAVWDEAVGSFRVLREQDGLPGRTIRQLAVAKDGGIWALAIPGGLCRIDPERLVPRPAGTDGPFVSAPTSIVAGLDGSIWIEDRDRLVAIRAASDGKASAEELAVPPEAGGTLGTMAVTRGGVLWSAGPKGLSRYDGKTFRVVHQQDGLAAGLVTEIAPAGDDELWVCYREPLGVTHLKWTEGLAPSVRHVRASDGLPSDEVFVLGLDSRGNVWAGGDRGAAVIGPDDAIAVIDHTRGLLWDDCSAGAFLAEEDGAVFLGTSRGLTRCDASTPLPAGRDVEAVLLSVRLGGREVRGASDPAIDGSDRSLLVRIAASTVGPRTAFRHRLVGISDDWTESADRTLSYPALPPGSYRLEVACATRHAAPPTAFSFVVRPHVWETAWGRGLLLVPLLLLVGAIVPIRTRALRRRHRELEQAVAARSAELAAKNRELEEASFTEPLTRVRNRRFFAAVVGDDVGRAKRAFKDGGVGRNRDLIFYMVDIDHFKEVNDVYGHRAGDQVLVQTAERLGALLRTTDLLVRWGGEEFLVVARDSDRADGDVLARRILEAFGKPLTLPDGGPIRKTCSVGWAPYPWLTGSPDALPYERVLNLADKALYIAKASGRNNAVGLIPPDEIGDLEDAEPVDHLDGITIRFLRTRGPGAPTS